MLLVLSAVVPCVGAQAPLAFPDLPAFSRPTDLVHAGDKSGRLFVVEQTGRIYVFDATNPQVAQRTLFLDLSGRVFESDLEGGALSLAFPPDYVRTGYFVVHDVAGSAIDPDGTRRSVIARYRVSDTDPNVADPTSEVVLLEVGQPHYNHNGGKVLFGPDGLLYIPLGDGGTLVELRANGQDRSTALGSVLRIDVEHPDPGRAYGIPPDNPFVGNTEGWLEEIWAWGFRSPWRSSFGPDGRLWVADVGQSTWEEINRVEAGLNYGWSAYEGPDCFEGPCEPAGKEFPVYVYPHGTETGFSITGGYVYRGRRSQGLAGQYVYADFVTGNVWALDVSDPEHPVSTRIGDAHAQAVAFGEDEAGELYLLGYNNGRIYDVGAWAVSIDVEPSVPASGARVEVVGANPFRASTTVRVTPRETGPVRVVLYDVLGREVARLADAVMAAQTPHPIPIDGRALAAGTYVVRVETAGGVVARPLLRVD